MEGGHVEGTDVTGLTGGLIGDTPQVMIDGDWHLGVLIDDKASKEQQDQLVAVFGGSKGGPMAGPATLGSKILPCHRRPIKDPDKCRGPTPSTPPHLPPPV